MKITNKDLLLHMAGLAIGAEDELEHLHALLASNEDVIESYRKTFREIADALELSYDLPREYYIEAINKLKENKNET